MGYQNKVRGDMEKVNESETIDKPIEEPFKPKVAWLNVFGFIVLHIAALYGLYLMLTLKPKILTYVYILLITLFCGIGITMGAHRLWSHKSFKAKLPLRLVLLLGQTMSGQNCLWVWVRDHRQHHKYSDTDADPHNSNRGFFFSHMGWLMMQKHPQVIAKGRQIDMKDLSADPWIMFQKRFYNILYPIAAIAIPVLVPCYFWNESYVVSIFTCYFFRYIFQLNATWCVNSVAHMFGVKPYNAQICPAENQYVSFFGLGEGWHNYHHTFPWDCQASEYGKYFNLTSTALNWLEKTGQAYDLKMATKEMMINRIQKYGDGTHEKY